MTFTKWGCVSGLVLCVVRPTGCSARVAERYKRAEEAVNTLPATAVSGGRAGWLYVAGGGCFRAGVGRMYVAEAAGMRASAVRCVKCRKSGLRRHGCGQGGDAGVRGSRPLGVFGLLRQPGDGRSLSVYTIGMGSERKEAGARKRGRVKTVTCETDVPRRAGRDGCALGNGSVRDGRARRGSRRVSTCFRTWTATCRTSGRRATRP